jgi:probable rRNA maturation factor
MSFDVRNTLRAPFEGARVPFKKIAEAILGKKYELSLVICGDDLAQKMNKEYRKKTYRPNVLSFPIAKNEGEIFLNVRCAERESRKYGVPLRGRIAFLFIHGCFHLKGLDHGTKMEKLEMRILKKFKLLSNSFDS